MNICVYFYLTLFIALCRDIKELFFKGYLLKSISSKYDWETNHQHYEITEQEECNPRVVVKVVLIIVLIDSKGKWNNTCVSNGWGCMGMGFLLNKQIGVPNL